MSARFRLRTEPLAGKTKECRQQRCRDSDGDQDRECGTDTHDAQERDADDEQSEKGDDDRHSGKQHCAPGRSDRFRGGLFYRVAVGELVSMSGQDEQGVVDAHRQPDHECEERCRA